MQIQIKKKKKENYLSRSHVIREKKKKEEIFILIKGRTFICQINNKCVFDNFKIVCVR